MVLNKTVVWWYSANLFTCKLEGGWWAPAIQQNVKCCNSVELNVEWVDRKFKL